LPGELELSIKLEADVREFEQKMNRLAQSFGKGLDENLKKTVQMYEQYSKQGYDRLAQYYAKKLDDQLKEVYGRFGVVAGKVVGATGGLFGMIRGEGVEEWKKVAEVTGGMAGKSAIAGIVSKLTVIGAVLMLIHDKIVQLLYKASEFSGYGRATLRLLSTIFKLSLKPIADAIGAVLMPILLWFLRNILIPAIRLWNRFFGKAEKEAQAGLVGGGLLGGAALGLLGAQAGGIMLGAVLAPLGLFLGAILGAVLEIVMKKVINMAKDLFSSTGFDTFVTKLKGYSEQLIGYVMIGLDKMFGAIDELFFWLADKVFAVAEKVADWVGADKLAKEIQSIRETLQSITREGLEHFGRLRVEAGKMKVAFAQLVDKIREESGIMDFGEWLKSEFGENSQIYQLWVNAGQNLGKFAEKLLEVGFKDEDLENIEAFVEKVKELGMQKEVLQSVKERTLEYWSAVEEYYTGQKSDIESLSRTASKSVYEIKVQMVAAKEAWKTLFKEMGDVASSLLGSLSRFKFKYKGVPPQEWMPTPVPGLYARQTGGEIPETGLYLLHRGEVVIPAWKVPELFRTGGVSVGSINVTVNVDRIDNELDLDRLAEEIGVRIMRNISRYGGV